MQQHKGITSFHYKFQTLSHFSNMNNFLNSQYLHKHQSILNHNKKRLNQEQVKRLEESFDSTKKLEPEQKLQLAKELGVPPRQIAIWYQNRRARWKNQSLELDYNALQHKLDTVLAEKRKIEKENERLRGELKKVNEMFVACKKTQGHEETHGLIPLNAANSISSGCEEGVVSCSSFQEDVSCSLVKNNSESNLQFDELYACLMGAEEGSNCRLSWQNGKDLWDWKN